MAKETKVKRSSALKRDLQNEKSRLRNKVFKSKMRTACRAFETALTSQDQNEARENLNLVYSIVDKGVKRGVFKLNKASRIKSRFTSKLISKTA